MSDTQARIQFFRRFTLKKNGIVEAGFDLYGGHSWLSVMNKKARPQLLRGGRKGRCHTAQGGWVDACQVAHAAGLTLDPTTSLSAVCVLICASGPIPSALLACITKQG